MSGTLSVSAFDRVQSSCFECIAGAKSDSLRDPHCQRFSAIWHQCRVHIEEQFAPFERLNLSHKWKKWVHEASAIKDVRERVLAWYDEGLEASSKENIQKLCSYFGIDQADVPSYSQNELKKVFFIFSHIVGIKTRRKLTFEEFEVFRVNCEFHHSSVTSRETAYAFKGLHELIYRIPGDMPKNDVLFLIRVYSRIVSMTFSLCEVPLSILDAELTVVREKIEGLFRLIEEAHGHLLQIRELSTFIAELNRNMEAFLTEMTASVKSLRDRVDTEIPDLLKERAGQWITMGDPEPAFRVSKCVQEVLQKDTVPLNFLEHILDIEEMLPQTFIDFIAAYERCAGMCIDKIRDVRHFSGFMAGVCYYAENLSLLPVLGSEQHEFEAALQYPWTEFTPIHLPSMLRFIGSGGSFRLFFTFYEQGGFFGVIPERYLIPSELTRINTLDSQEFRKLLALPVRFSVLDLLPILKNDSLSTFVHRMSDTSLDLPTLTELWLQFQNLSLSPRSVKRSTYDSIKKLLTLSERVHLLSGIDIDEMSIPDFYDLEEGGQLETVIHRIPLSRVPVELLIRYISSVPTQTVFQWLEEMVPTVEGFILRVDTLSNEQRGQILRRFRRFASSLPQEEWMKAFRISEDAAYEVCRTTIHQTSSEEELWHAHMQQLIDPRDATSLFIALWDSGKSFSNLEQFRRIVVELLLRASEHTICGARDYIAWGGCSADSSLCCAPDGLALIAKIQGKRTPVYQRGLFNDPLFSVAAFSLRARLLSLMASMTKEVFCGLAPLSGEALEVRYEVDRIAGHLAGRFSYLAAVMDPFVDSPIGYRGMLRMAEEPLLSESSGDLTPSLPSDTVSSIAVAIQSNYRTFLSTEEWRTSATLLELVRALYNHVTRSPQFSVLYEEQSRSNTAAYCLLTFLLLSRTSDVIDEGACCTVKLSPRTQIRIEDFTHSEYEEDLLDNPWLSPPQFFSAVSDYALHTLTPLSPHRNMGKTFFASLVSAVHALTPEVFYSLCEKCLSLRTIVDDTSAHYVEAFNELWPKEGALSDHATICMVDLLDHYLSFVSDAIQNLKPNTIYYYNLRGIHHFSDANLIPCHLRSEGNFASAVCRFFTAIIPGDHSGNCCVESILTAVNGVEAYNGSEGRSRLETDIRDFRHRIAEYGRAHEQELREKIGEKEATPRGGEDMEGVDRFLRRYDQSPYDEWTYPAAILCASRVLQRPIRIFSRYGDVFQTDESGSVIPAAIFEKAGETTGIPIDLMYWDRSHYCLLVSKAPSDSGAQLPHLRTQW